FLNLLHKLSQKYGDIYLVHLFSTPYVVLSHPKYIEPIVSSSEIITKGRSYEVLKIWLGQGLLTATGQRWRTHRKFLTPAFHFNILQNFFPIFCKNGRILNEKLDALADGKPINLFPIIALAALDNVTEAIMGVSVNAQKKSDSEYVKSIEILSKILALRMQVPIIGDDVIFNLLPHKKTQDKALHFLQAQTNNVIEARKQDLKKMNMNSLGGSNDIVTFQGHDTTTSGIVYSLFCISKYPDIQDKIYEEQKIIFVDDIQRDPTYANPAVFEDPLEFRPERFESGEIKNPFSYLVFSAGPRNCI
ncbi:Cytochrome P450 CYP4L4, partial [Operophtera brumata]